MNVEKIRDALLQQKEINLSGNLYYKTQIEFSYNSNHIEGSTISKDETMSLFDRGTILTSTEKVVSLKDMNETRNHFTLFNYMLDSLDNPLSENLIKKFHFILLNGTLNDKQKEWFNVGEYKKVQNYVDDVKTSSTKNVEKDMNRILTLYFKLKKVEFENIIEFHVDFEKIHPFQDGNGRVGRMIIFRECLVNNIIPFYIEDRNREFYIRGLKKWRQANEKGYLIDTCLNSQDNYMKICRFFLDS